MSNKATAGAPVRLQKETQHPNESTVGKGSRQANVQWKDLYRKQ